MKRGACTVLLLLCAMSFAVAIPFTTAQVTPSVKVAASIEPLAGLAGEVGGTHVLTSVLLPEGIEPHAASLPPQAVTDAEDADLLVLTGHFPWEQDLVSQVSTPYVTLEDVSALENYEDYGARLSDMPGAHDEGEAMVAAQHEHEENPHGWWLLPTNALAIANATRAALTILNSSLSPFWEANFDTFYSDVEALLQLVNNADAASRFSSMTAVVVSPAEAYIAEAFGIQVEAVLQVDEVLVSGAELLEIQASIRNGTINLIIGSDVARLQAGGEYAVQLSEDYDLPLVWCRAVFFEGLADYIAVMTYNLGSLTSGMDGGIGPGGGPVNLALIGLAGVFGLVAVLEAIILVRRAQNE
ncbi:MAG: zinc ABC transporter substrate-binding protein [Candidatus Thorarchaeota archaeon]|nr:MAG: zinc ABC transporter substrate-binding protein [Candidatus Thorarchaeota archaeon]